MSSLFSTSASLFLSCPEILQNHFFFIMTDFFKLFPALWKQHSVYFNITALLSFIFKYNCFIYFFKIGFVIQSSFRFKAKLEGGTELSHVPPASACAHPSPLSTSSTRVVHLLPLMNLHWHLIIIQRPQCTIGFTLNFSFWINTYNSIFLDLNLHITGIWCSPVYLNHCDGFLIWVGKVVSAMEATVLCFQRWSYWFWTFCERQKKKTK